MTERLTAKDIDEEGLADWRLLARALHARFRTGDFTTGLRLLNEIGAAAEDANHHPDLDLRYTHLDVALMSHDAFGVTRRDVDMARRISELAAVVGARPQPQQVARLELALDTADKEAQVRFWSAVLGVEAASEDDIIDLSEQLPTLWFQDTEPHDEPRQRFHIDFWVPADVAQDRIQAALAAGGTMVSDAEAPSFWVLADPEGNKVCICTSQSRD